MKKIIIALLLIANAAVAQDSQQKVWNLLLSNKREDARKQFDKDLKKNADKNAELLLLDAIIDQQMGRISYSPDFLKKFSAFPDSPKMLYSIWYYPFAIGDVNSDGYDDLSYEKMDLIAGTDAFKNDLHVIYNKAIFDRKRRNFDSCDANLNKLGGIDKWQFCGVFENMNGSGLETEYEPESYAKNDKKFNANSNGFVGWYTPFIPQKEGFHFYLNEKEYGNGIIYAQTFITSDADRQVVLHFASGGPLKIFLNDVEVYSNDKIFSTDINAYQLKFNLKKGVNRLMLKSATGGRDYFFAALKGEAQNPVQGLLYSDTWMPYTKGTLAEINPVEVKPDFETYLEQKIKQAPDSPLYRLLLFNVYSNNHKNDDAYAVIEPLKEKYPNSSLLATYLIRYYENEDDSAKVEELKKNLLATDEDYYYSLIYKFTDGEWLKSANISELEKYRDKTKKMYSPQYTILYDYIIALRNSDVDLSFKKLEELMNVSNNNELYITSFSHMYASMKNDKQKTVSILEELLAKRENYAAQSSLIDYYNSMGRKDDVNKLVVSRIEHFPYFNNVYEDAITIANNENRYEETLKYVDAGLKNFPYSFILLEEKGRGYNSLKKTDDAQKYFKESLLYNSGNSKLRKTLYDIAKMPDEIAEVGTKDIYNVIKQRRNSKLPNDFGVNVLLDEYLVNILPEGARKSKTLTLYEVTAENGIEELKEFSVGGSDLNILKAEIVKPDGSIVPGEQNYDTVVFTNLKVGDVIYMEYENTDVGTGRFYKDFTINSFFNGSYPSQQTIFGIIHPNDLKFEYNITNGNVPSKTRKLKDRTYISWEQKNVPALALSENYSPNYNDYVNKIMVSSIKSWADIANWYADLVKKNMKMDNIAIKTYNEIFPNGTTGMTQEAIAMKIYKYIGENITYSSLDFRQSGYVPQKPSKTISSKLGDCKDVSTLFVAMADRAGLRANLVLVQTNDNGTQSLKLPSLSFNHCIVKVMLDGREYFLEMTDKYLPFKALPISLYNANALVISFDKAESEKAALINIPFTNALTNSVVSVTTLDVTDDVKKFTNIHTMSGANKSYYNEIFSAATTEDYRKKDFEESFNSLLNKTISLEEATLISNERFDPEIKFRTKFSIPEKLQSVGSLKIMEVPYFDKIYTRNIIANEKRNYDINYPVYENINNYRSEVVINIPQGRKFTEIPEGHEFTYKNHKYKISYELVAPGSLKVVREANVSWDTIKAAEYPEFKKFVETIIAAEEEIIGFK